MYAYTLTPSYFSPFRIARGLNLTTEMEIVRTCRRTADHDASPCLSSAARNCGTSSFVKRYAPPNKPLANVTAPAGFVTFVQQCTSVAPNNQFEFWLRRHRRLDAAHFTSTITTSILLLPVNVIISCFASLLDRRYAAEAGCRPRARHPYRYRVGARDDNDPRSCRCRHRLP
jgi:hypothetical protein